jgi:hypothetical protein
MKEQTYMIRTTLTDVVSVDGVKAQTLVVTAKEAANLIAQLKLIKEPIDLELARTFFFDSEGYMVDDDTAVTYYLTNYKEQK